MIAVLVFLDAINTRAEVGTLKEVICDDSFKEAEWDDSPKFYTDGLDRFIYWFS